MYDGRSVTAFALLRGLVGANQGVPSEQVTNDLPDRARSLPVDHTHGAKSLHVCVAEVLIEPIARVFSCKAPEVEL
jgi:hypothetical protein